MGGRVCLAGFLCVSVCVCVTMLFCVCLGSFGHSLKDFGVSEWFCVCVGDFMCGCVCGRTAVRVTGLSLDGG